MTLPPVAYARPATLEQATELLRDPAARALAGGQSLLPALAAARGAALAGGAGALAPVTLVDLSRIPGLDRLALDPADGALRIGALVTQRAAERSPLVAERAPLLAQALAQVGHPSIRNRGTVVGSLAHADPAAEVPAAAVALGGSVLVAGPGGARRELPAERLLAGPHRTTLAPGELIVELRLPAAATGERQAWLEFAPRRFDLPLVGAAVRVIPGAGARLTLAGVAPTPTTAVLPSHAENGAAVVAVERAVAALDPPSDARASGPLRSRLARTLALRALARAADDATPPARPGPLPPAAPPARAGDDARAPAAALALRLTVDGAVHRPAIDARETLAEVLRERCGALGVRVGCGEGHCGACTVTLDGRTVRSCTVLAAQADGARIETVEALAPAGAPLHPLQRAFVAEHALQCGFCTAGMLLSARELLTEDPAAGDEAIRAGLAGNLCRCTGYQGIVRAVRRARDEAVRDEGDARDDDDEL